MAKIEYDPFAGWARLLKAEQQIDDQAPLILTYHAALERELDEVLSRLLPCAEKIKRIGYGHKVSVLAAAWVGDPDACERLVKTLIRFGDLRNAVAHGDASEVKEAMGRLQQAYEGLGPTLTTPPTLPEIAGGICAFLGDGPTPAEFGEIAQGLGAVLKRYAECFSSFERFLDVDNERARTRRDDPPPRHAAATTSGASPNSRHRS